MIKRRKPIRIRHNSINESIETQLIQWVGYQRVSITILRVKQLIRPIMREEILRIPKESRMTSQPPLPQNNKGAMLTQQRVVTHTHTHTHTHT